MKKNHIINTDRIEIFCQYYLQSGKTAESYMKAGYNCSSRASALSASSRLLNTPKARSILNELKKRFFQQNDFQGSENEIIERENELLKKEVSRLNKIISDLKLKILQNSNEIKKIKE